LASTLILDVRSRAEFAEGHLTGALNIPHLELRARLDEIAASAAGRTLSVHCASGVRSYLATRILLSQGYDARNLSGGWLTLQAVHPGLSGMSAAGATLIPQQVLSRHRKEAP